MTDPLFNQIAIIGPGLLGGSLGMAALERQLAAEVVGITRVEASIEEARRQGAITRGTTNLREGIAGADLIVLCTPVRHIIETLPEVMEHAKPSAIVTDVGSTKGSIAAAGDALAQRTGCHFVGSHPMAGSEKGGVHHARPNLYADSTCFVTRTEQTNMEAFTRVCALWRGLGARLVISRPARHDRLVATISHLPHLAAVALVRAVESYSEDKNLIKGIIGNGFRDTTRIAGGNSQMWEDICTDNRDEILRAREALIASFNDLMEACQPDTCDSLRELLDDAREYREFL